MVHFVGAGPGAVDLITVRGQNLLKNADVVIYAGSLVNPALLQLCKENAEIYDSAYLNLDEVIQIVKEAEEKGLDIVRLHTGDPSIFGAIREQMDRLREEQIAFDICPGVSSFFGAAASAEVEYTLPDVSQTVIISRMEGRTPVPKGQELRDLARHKATLVLFLSVGMAEKVEEELILGGYHPDTPVAICYKVTWPEEKILRGTLKELAELAKRENITKTALILVGDVMGKEYSLSKLYDANFETEYRKKKKRKKLSIFTYTDKGTVLGNKIKSFSEGQGWFEEISLYERCKEEEILAKEFVCSEVLLFVGATGIAVRKIAPYLQSKVFDPAVLSVDEKGTHVISLVSGHLGGANDWSKKIADILEGEAVISTATDVEGKFAVDNFAKKNELFFEDYKQIQLISSAILKDETVGVYTKNKVLGKMPSGVVYQDVGKLGIEVVDGLKKETRFESQCTLFSKNLVVGIGCKAGKTKEEIDAAIQEVFAECGVSEKRISALASIDVKQEEKGLLEYAAEKQLPLSFYTAEELGSLEGDFTPSAFVAKQVGVDNVCERSAMYCAGEEAELLLKKQALNGVTIAIAGGKQCYMW